MEVAFKIEFDLSLKFEPSNRFFLKLLVVDYYYFIFVQVKFVDGGAFDRKIETNIDQEEIHMCVYCHFGIPHTHYWVASPHIRFH